MNKDIWESKHHTEDFLKGLTKLTGIPGKKLQQYAKENNLFNILEHPQTIEPSAQQLEKIYLLNRFIASYNLLKVFEGENKIRLDSPTKSGQYFVPLLSGIKDKEKLLVVFLDNSLNIIETRTISEGTLGQTVVYPRDILKAALACDCKSLVVAHNHPGNSINPSIEDKQITQKLVDIFTPLGINLLDHIIVGGLQYYSMAEDGKIPQCSNSQANYQSTILSKCSDQSFEEEWEDEI